MLARRARQAAISGLVAASMAVGPALASGSCARPLERTAFTVTALKSQLMVTALSCAQQDRYNAFVMRYRPNLAAYDHTLVGYFGRAYGRRGQQQHDDFVTSLANEQSMQGTKLGNGFCNQNVAMFDEVMALQKPTDLPNYAAGKTLAQPMALNDCPALVTRARVRVVSHRKKTLHS